MERVISVSLGELILKGGNRRFFEDKLVKKIREAIKEIGYENIYKGQGKIYIEYNRENEMELIEKLKKVFGLVYISPCYKVEKDIESIEKAVKRIVEEKLEVEDLKTFKVTTNRVDKSFPLESPKISRDMGGVVLKNFGDKISVDVHNPDFHVYIDIKDFAYIYIDRYEGHRGLPVGTNGRGLLLLSGGIDSPVAGFMMAKRGVKISSIHFHSYPFTSERAEEKVKNLAEILTFYTGKMRMYSINLLEIQKAINKNCPPEEMTILSRRFMMRIADRVAEENNLQAIITGENLGQVASQTMESMTVINSTIKRPILRPLVGFDKVDIMDIARDIETYETSIQPFDDCCSLFLPDKPMTKPKLEEIENSELNLEIDELVNNAIKDMKIYTIGQ